MHGSLQELFPEIAAEWDYEKNKELSPSGVLPHSNKYVWWKCKEGHEWYAKINNRTSKNTMCPYCAHKLPIKGVNDFASLYPNLLAEWDFEKNALGPTEVFPQSNKRVAWKCKLGHEWKARIDHRVNGNGCPFCSGLMPIPGKTDLASVIPDVAALWNSRKNGDISPTDVTPWSHKKCYWICPKGHEWLSPVETVVKSYSLNSSRTGCPICSGKVTHADNCLATVSPELANEWSDKNTDLTPLDVTLHSNISVWWRCPSCGHEWKTKINNRANGTGCPACAHTVVTPETSLAYLSPELASEWDTDKNVIGPDKVAACSNLQYWWRCENGHSWEAVVSNRYILHHGCPYCANRAIIPGENDFKTQYPDIAAEWDAEKNELSADAVAPHSNVRYWWKCVKGHSWTASVFSRTNGSSCPYCANRAIIQGENDFKTRYPDIAAEWDDEKNELSADAVAPHSNVRYWWKCAKGHSWTASASSRVNGSSCPICNGRVPHKKRCQ